MKGGVIYNWSGSRCRCRCRCRRHLFLRNLFLQETCVFLCHTRCSHLASMGLCRHGPRQRRLDQQLDLARPPIGAGSRPPQSEPAAGPGGAGCGRLEPGRAPACSGGPCLACSAVYYNPLFLHQGSFIRGAEEGAGTALMRAHEIITNNHPINLQ